MTAPLPLQTPPTLVALEDYPLLRASVAASVARQAARIAERTALFGGRRSTLTELQHVAAQGEGGLIVLEGPPGSGVTTLLAHLAATLPAAFWFGDDDAGQGAAALAAQVIALRRLSIPLVAPAVERNPLALEQLLDEVAAQPAGPPLLLLLDLPAGAGQPRDPLPPPLPLHLPPGILAIYGCTPGAALPWTPRHRLTLPLSGEAVARDTAAVLSRLGHPPEWLAPLAAAAQGNMLYLRLACRMLQHTLLDLYGLPPGLEALHAAWWSSLAPADQRLALLLAAAGEPLPLDLCAELLGGDPLPCLGRWDDLGLIAYEADPTPAPTDESDSTWRAAPSRRFALYHAATREYLARSQSTALAQLHADLAEYAVTRGLDHPTADYATRQFSRHAALAPAPTRDVTLPLVVQRRWVVAQERRTGAHACAARDLAWELEVAATDSGPLETHDPLVRLVRGAVLTGTLAARARILDLDAALAAVTAVLAQRGREAGLKRVLDLVEQLPDGRDKALALRRIGEVCHEARMRTSAMRLLSRALDLEELTLPRAWREQREQLHAALAQAALDQGAIDAALRISARIGHAERRGMAETQVVRRLLEQSGRPAAPVMARARQIACAITHESMGAWARAEVAAALARSGDLPAAEELLAAVAVETARAWAQIEIACILAAHDEDAARRWIDQLNNPNQRDRGLARLAHTLARLDKDGDALAAAEQIGDVEVRVSALLDLRLTLEGLVAMLALERATAEIGALNGPARAPLLAALAAAHAALDRRERAMGIATQLNEGEERDRALSRVAVAFAQQGNHAEGQATARALADDDERDWAIDELTRLLGGAGRWSEAETLAQEISAADQRDRTLAELAIARARADDPLAARDLALTIAAPVERTRALVLIAPVLVAAGQVAAALAVGEGEPGSRTAAAFAGVDARSRYRAAVAAALADQGDLAQARALAGDRLRPLDQARVHLAVARAVAPRDPRQAFAALGAALHVSTVGRDEAFRVLEQATPVLARLGGAPLLAVVAEAIDEIDSW